MYVCQVSVLQLQSVHVELALIDIGVGTHQRIHMGGLQP